MLLRLLTPTSEAIDKSSFCVIPSTPYHTHVEQHLEANQELIMPPTPITSNGAPSCGCAQKNRRHNNNDDKEFLLLMLYCVN